MKIKLYNLDIPVFLDKLNEYFANKNEFDYAYKVFIYHDHFLIKIWGRRIIRSLYINPILKGFFSKHNDEITLQIKYNLSFFGYMILLLFIFSIPFNIKIFFEYLFFFICAFSIIYVPQLYKLKYEFNKFLKDYFAYAVESSNL